jgi:hypothetical protein
MPSLARFHYSLLRQHPTPDQLKLYASFPEYRGFSNTKKNRELFVSAFVTGLWLTRHWDRRKAEFRLVVFAVPEHHMSWATDSLGQLIRCIKKVRSKRPLYKRRRGDQNLQNSLSHLLIGSNVYFATSEPPFWVAFGFSSTAPAPKWLKHALLKL